MEVEATINIDVSSLKLVDGVLELNTEQAMELKNKLVEILPSQRIPEWVNPYQDIRQWFQDAPTCEVGSSLGTEVDKRG